MMRIIKDTPGLLVVKVGDNILPLVLGATSVVAGLSMMLAPQSFSERSGDLNARWIGFLMSGLGIFALANANTVIMSFDKNIHKLTVVWRVLTITRKSQTFELTDVKHIGLRLEDTGNYSPWKCAIGFKNRGEVSFRIGVARQLWQRDRLLLGEIARTVCQRIASFLGVVFEDRSGPSERRT